MKYVDGRWNGQKLEIALATTGSSTNIRNALKHCASKQGSKIALIYLLTEFDNSKWYEGFKRYNGLRGTSQYKKFDMIICVYKDNIVHVER